MSSKRLTKPKKGTKKPSPLRGAQAKADAKAIRNILIFIIAPVIIFAGINIAVDISRYREATRAQQKIETYLEDKYGKDFVVERPVRSGYGFAIEGVLKAEAYPADSSNLIFTASTSSISTKDDYITTLWKSDGESYLAPIVNSVYGENIDFTANVATPIFDKAKAVGDVPPSLDQALREGYTSIRIYINSKERVTAANKRELAEKIYSVAQDLQEAQVQIFFVHYRVNGVERISYEHPSTGPAIESLDELINQAEESKYE